MERVSTEKVPYSYICERAALEEEAAELREQVTTLEELLQLYEESATEQEQRLQGTLSILEERALQLEHAQEALKTLQTTLDSMGDAVIVADSNGRALFVNPAAQLLLGADGLAACEVASLPLTRAVKGESIDAAELPLAPQDNRATQWLSVTARPIIAADATAVTGAVAVFRDVTQRKQFEQELQQSHQSAQEQAQLLERTLNRLKQTQAQLIHGEKMASLGQTVAGVAHEINNPVNFIHGNLPHARAAFQDLLGLVRLFQSTYIEKPGEEIPDAIAEVIEDIDLDFLADDIPAMLSSMVSGTERIREIVKSLRVFSRLDESELKAVDMHQGIDSAVVMVRSKFKSTDKRSEITLETDYSPCRPLKCHSSQLNQVFGHLLLNAVDALAGPVSHPKIIIRTRSDEQTLVVEVEDNGEGIPTDIQPKIFDPFFTTKPVGQGTGLGLSTCYQIVVEMHGGSLECFSTPGEGSRFVVALPYK